MQFAHVVPMPEAAPCAEVRDLVELCIKDTPQYDPYEDKLQNAKMFPCWTMNQR